MIYIIKGDEPYFINQKVNEILAKINCEPVKFDGYSKNFSIDEVIDNCVSFSLFSSESCVILENPPFLIKKGDDKDNEKIINYCQNPVYENTLILYTLDNNFNEKLKTYKEIANNAQVINCNKLKYGDFERFCNSEINNSKIVINNDARSKLIDSVKFDASLFKNNLEILKLYPGKIDLNAVNALCNTSDDNDAYDLVNAIINKDISRAFSLERQMLTDDNSVLGIVGLIANQLRFLYFVDYLKKNGNSQKEIADIIHCHPYRIQKSFETLSHFSANSIPELLSELSDLDVKSKTENIDEKLMFELFVLRLMKN